MNRSALVRFFRLLSREFPEPCRIVLTGAAAGALYGRVLPTLDVDFALKLKARSGRKKSEQWEAFRKAAARVKGETGIALQYGEDIDRWSSVSLLDYEKQTRRFQKFGEMEVTLLEPSYWAIGKLSRYLDPDVRDLVQVLRRTKTSWRTLCPVLGRALRKSPKSTACFQFKRQVEDFLAGYGRKIWGKNFSAYEAIGTFRRSAGVRS